MLRGQGWARRDNPAHSKVLVLCLALLTLVGIVGAVALVAVRALSHDVEALGNDGQVLTQLEETERHVLLAERALEQAITFAPGPERDAAFAEHDEELNAANDTLAELSVSVQATDVPEYDAIKAAYRAALGPILTLRSGAQLGFTADLLLDSRLEARAALTELRSQIELATTGRLEPTLAGGSRDAVDHADTARDVILAVLVVGILLGLAASRLSYRTAKAQHAEIARRDAERDRGIERSKIESRLSKALEFSRTEDDAFATVQEALAELLPARGTELLLADSSRAHLHAVAHADAEGRPGCGVATPTDCPAVAKGQTLMFERAGDFDACPHLRVRADQGLSAACVPVSLNGRSAGVLHSVGAEGAPIDADDQFRLETIAHRAGERIGVLRAFSRSEIQAATDPLTGLDNRRSFENKVAALLNRGVAVTIAFGDLDHFKQLNDKYGHDVGDRALRAFARAFRNSVRPEDIIARWGGEEFVAAFPETGSAEVLAVLDRVRVELASVVAAGGVPSFTVSFGVSDWRDGEDLESLIELADTALLAAKRAGRDRVLIAGDRDGREVGLRP